MYFCDKIEILLSNLMELRIKTFEQLSATELYELLKARAQVFVMEQQILYVDMDDIDYKSIHVFLWNNNKVIACARLFQEDNLAIWHVGRMLTIERGKGYGKWVMQEVIQQAWQQGAIILRMEAQTHAIGFYEQLGFRCIGEKFEEEGILHIRMEMSRPNGPL